jgi:hypothetical protein
MWRVISAWLIGLTGITIGFSVAGLIGAVIGFLIATWILGGRTMPLK